MSRQNTDSTVFASADAKRKRGFFHKPQIDPSWEPYLDLLTGKQAFFDVITQKEYDLNVEIRSVSFENAQEVFTTIAKYDSAGDTPVFYIENRPVSSDEFNDYLDRWQARKDADYFDLNIFQDTIPN